MSHRLKPILAKQLSTGQNCGITGRSILDALATVRDVIAYHESTPNATLPAVAALPASF